MGAWLLLLLVLATFQPIIQVASTEETSASTSTSTPTSITTSKSLSYWLPPSHSLSSSPISSLQVIDNFNSNNKLSDSDNSDLTRRTMLTKENANIETRAKQTVKRNMLSEQNIVVKSSSHKNMSSQYKNDNDGQDKNVNHTNDDSSKDLNNIHRDNSIPSVKRPLPDTLVEIENGLLTLFNMKKPPKIDRSKIIIPEAMKKLYAQIMGEELDSVNLPKPGLLTKSANTMRSFTHQESKIDDRFPHHHRFRLHFNVSTIPKEEKLKAAELNLNRELSGHLQRISGRSYYRVLVYDILKVGIKGKREPTYLLLDSKQIRLNSTNVISFDVQPAVDRWLASPKNNNGLLIEVRTSKDLKPAPEHHVRLRRSIKESPESWSHKQPLLFTYTDDGRHKARSIRDMSRPKRAHHSRKPQRRKNNDEICRRHSLYVDFADVGWADWIVAPPGYEAFYCHGKCPFPLAEHLNTTNHAVIQTLVNNIHPGKVPKPCCVPTQLTGISMLYLNDEKSVVLKSYQDMTVVGCGCR